MTFQVALRGSDGVVLASDTKMVSGSGARTGWTSTKIFCHADRGLAYACSGEKIALTAGQFLSQRLESKEVKLQDMGSLLMQVGQQAWREQWGYEPVPRELIGTVSSLLVAWNQQGESKLWRLDIYHTPDCYQIDDKVVAGDTDNPAVFVLEHYYPDKLRPVVELILLAAHTVLMAAQHNPEMISGLEMVVCKDGSCQPVSAEELTELRSRSHKLDENMGHGLYAPE